VCTGLPFGFSPTIASKALTKSYSVCDICDSCTVEFYSF
jgi:hypothetical protein